MKILFAYDGSESADAAIAAAGQLLAGRDTEAIVLSVWEPLIVEALHASKFGGRFSVPTSVPETDERSEHHALQLAHRPLLVIPPAGAPAGRPLEHATAGEAS
jgi:Universal stress protein family